MPKLSQVITEDERLVFEAIKLMAADPTTVEAMTRTQLYLHMDIRERMLKSQYGPDWQRHFDVEFQEKRELWEAARDLHELEKQARAKR